VAVPVAGLVGLEDVVVQAVVGARLEVDEDEVRDDEEDGRDARDVERPVLDVDRLSVRQRRVGEDGWYSKTKATFFLNVPSQLLSHYFPSLIHTRSLSLSRSLG